MSEGMLPLDLAGLSSSTVKIKKRHGRRNVIYWVEGMKLEAVMDYQGKTTEELSFSRGDIITYVGDRDESSERIRGCVGDVIGWVPISCVDVRTSLVDVNRSRAGSKERPSVASAPSSPATHHHAIKADNNGALVSALRSKFEPIRTKSEPNGAPPVIVSPIIISPATSPPHHERTADKKEDTGNNLPAPNRIFGRFSLSKAGRPRSGSDFSKEDTLPILTTFTSDIDSIRKILEAKEEPSQQATLSDQTRQQVSNCKRFFKEYYQTASLEIMHRKERLAELEKELATVTDEIKRKSLVEAHRQRETNILRSKRAKQSLDDFDIIDMIGRGGFGKVFLCSMKEDGALVALKKIKKAVILERNKLESLMTEREVLTILNRTESPWLIKLVCSFQDNSHFYFAMEFASGGNLKNLLETRMLTEGESKFYISEMMSAVDHLHRLGFVHRDLKPDNFLFDHSGHVKLADFGLSKGGILKRMDITGKDGQIKLKSVRIYLHDGTFRTLALQESPNTEYKPVDFDSELTPSPYVGNVVHTMLKKLDLPEKDAKNWHLWEAKPDGKHRMMDSSDMIFDVPNMKLSSAANLFSIHEVKGAERHYFLFKRYDEKDPRSRQQQESVNNAALLRSKRVSVLYQAHKLNFDNMKNPHQSVRLDVNEINKRREFNRSSTNKSAMYSFVGSPYYMAPEIITRNGYDELVDWWSLGCILYEMVIGFPPFMGDTPHEVFDNIVDHDNVLQFPDEEPMDEEGNLIPIDLEMSDTCKEIIRRLLSSAHKRIGKNQGFEEIRKHKFFADVDWPSLRNKTPPFQPELSGPTDTSYFRIDADEKNDTIMAPPPNMSRMSATSPQMRNAAKALAEDRAPRRVPSLDLLVGFSWKG